MNWRRNLHAVTAASFVGFMGFTSVTPFLPLYIRSLGVTDVAEIALWTGLALGVTPALTAIGGPFWGRFADRYGNKVMVQRSMAAFTVINISMGFVSQAWHLVALRTILGFIGGFGPVTLSMAAQSAPREHMPHAISTVQTAHRLGPALGPVVGGTLAPLLGLRLAFVAAGMTYLIAFFVITFFYKEPPRQAHAEKRAAGRVTFRSILAFENFLLLMAVIFGLQLVDRSFGPVLPLYIGQLGYSAERVPLIAGVLFSTLAVAGALGNQVSARLVTRTSTRVLIAAAAVSAATGVVMLAAVTSVWALTIAMALAGAGIGAATTAAFTAAGAVIPSHVHTTAFSFLTGAALAGLAISPMLAGLIGGRSIRTVFIGGAVVLLVLAVLVRRVMVERPQHPEKAPPVEDAM